MRVVDAQLHAWIAASEAFPWHRPSVEALGPAAAQRYRTDNVSAERLVWMMDAVGVDAAVLTSPYIYGDDHRYVFAAAGQHPGRFGVVGRLFASTPDPEDRLAAFREQPWAIGIRLVVLPSLGQDILSEPYRRILAAAEKEGVPVFVLAVGMLAETGVIAREFPSALIVLDHLGLHAFDPNVDRLGMLPDLLALAACDNVVVKCTAAPSLSREPYPFLDLWPHLHRILDAFGIERVMWGTDITQHFVALTYCEAVDYLRRSDELSDTEKDLILGGNARRILPWPAAAL
jgi:L-fuconolactonase